MMEEALHGEFPLSLLDRRGDDHRRAARPAAGTFDPVAQYGPFLWASPNMPLTGRTPRRAGTRHSAVLTATRQAVAAIRLWRARARSRQELRELSDHLLKDIGLRREEVGYEFPTLFWRRD
jgi:uncharacterized protein YjiS (DUF1127 family)